MGTDSEHLPKVVPLSPRLLYFSTSFYDSLFFVNSRLEMSTPCTIFPVLCLAALLAGCFSTPPPSAEEPAASGDMPRIILEKIRSFNRMR